MKHLVINDYGTYLGVKDGLLLVKSGDDKKKYPINRLSSLSIAKRGVSLSSDLIEALSNRGIKLFFLGFKGTMQASLIGNSHHGVALARMNQYHFCSNNTLTLAKKIIESKIKNQRAVLNYFAKYHKNDGLTFASDKLKEYAAKSCIAESEDVLLGYEGTSARCYFEALRDAQLFHHHLQIGKVGAVRK